MEVNMNKIAGLLGKIEKEDAEELIRFIQALVSGPVKFQNLELQRIELDVAAGDTTYSKEITTQLRHRRIVGVALNITDEDVLEGTTMSLKIDGKEVFAPGTDARLIFSSVAVAPNERFFNYLNHAINQTKVDVSFTSAGFSSAYKANFYLLCTIDE